MSVQLPRIFTTNESDYCAICLNLLSYDELDGEFAKITDSEYIGICDHEQYFYPDYFAYQSDYADKIYKMCEIVTKNGFRFIEGAEILK